MGKKMTARAQVVRVADEALRRKRAGETVSAIYDDLTARGEIDMVLRSFSRWVGRFEHGMEFVPLDTQIPLVSRPDANAASGQTHPAALSKSNPSPAASPTDKPVGFRHARIGVAVAPLPNMEPDRKALLGDDG